MMMTLLFTALIALLVAALCIYLLRMVSPDANLTNVGSVIIIIVAVLVIARSAGVF